MGLRLKPKTSRLQRKWGQFALVSAMCLNAAALIVGLYLSQLRDQFSECAEEKQFFIINEQSTKAELTNSDLTQILRTSLQIQHRLASPLLNPSEDVLLTSLDKELESKTRASHRRIAGAWYSMAEELPSGTNVDSIISRLPSEDVLSFAAESRTKAFKWIHGVQERMNSLEASISSWTWFHNALIALGIIVLAYGNLLLFSIGEFHATDL